MFLREYWREGEPKDGEEENSAAARDGVSYVLPFVLITACFALWGFANDITNPMVKAFAKIFRTTTTGRLARAGRLLRRLFRDGVPGRGVHPEIFVQGRHPARAGALCGRGAAVFSGQADREFLSVPDGLLYPDLRLVISRNQRESVYPVDGERRDVDAAAEFLRSRSIRSAPCSACMSQWSSSSPGSPRSIRPGAPR